ncbi:MAG: hydrolase [Betaproteobacteria bacterium]|nr:hydrolase [Betaproteobacteria bacterium]
MNSDPDPHPYCPPRWLRGAHAQTIYPLFIKGRPPPTRRQRWDTPDGDFIDVDFLAGAAADAPLVVLFHGLEGSVRSHYARALLRHAATLGWQAAVVHFRGCSGVPNLLPRAYHSGDWQEIDWILRRLRELFPGVPRLAVGVSLGGNALLKWLGQMEEDARGVVDAACAVCAPLDLTASGRALEQGFARIYTRHFLVSLKRNALAKLERHPGLFDRERVLAARTLYQFDDVVTAPLHGFRNATDYWTRASSRPCLGGIRVPTLLLNALNDPFLPVWALPCEREVSSMVVREFPAEGGHVGFVRGAPPGRLDWLPRRMARFLAGACPPR